MKKSFWSAVFTVASFLTLSIFLFSCSNPQGTVLTAQEKTLRTAVKEKTGTTNWSKEIEPELLKRDLDSGISISNKELLTPQLLETYKGLQTAVYPSIKDFESLDCTSMNSLLYDAVKKFCTALCNDLNNLQEYFDSGYFFNYVFFKKDLENFLLENTEIEIAEDKKLFEKYNICRAFEGDKLIQVPVRFYNKKEYVDLSVYLAYHGGYKITQIQIIRWGHINGESENKKSE